jgi:hypothetical protein
MGAATLIAALFLRVDETHFNAGKNEGLLGR